MQILLNEAFILMLCLINHKAKAAMLHAIIRYCISYLSTEWGSHFLGTRTSFECRLRLKCDGTRAKTRFRLSPKWTSPFKSEGASVLSTAGSRGVRISGSNAGYTMFRGSVKSTGYPLHLPVSPSLPLPCVTVCHQISTGLYILSLEDNSYICDILLAIWLHLWIWCFFDRAS
jgi:hypothetical protein